MLEPSCAQSFLTDIRQWQNWFKIILYSLTDTRLLNYPMYEFRPGSLTKCNELFGPSAKLSWNITHIRAEHTVFIKLLTDSWVSAWGLTGRQLTMVQEEMRLICNSALKFTWIGI